MLSPNRIPSKRNGRAPSTWSIDSGYGSGLHEDTKLGVILGARDTTSDSAAQQLEQQQRPIGLGIEGPMKQRFGDHVFIKEEESSDEPTTPRLRLRTTMSNPSSPEPISPASPSEVRRSHARKTASKLPLQAIGRLTAWLDANRHHPYPTAETKQALAEACNITIKQVTTWFTNTRQRQLKSQEDDGRVGNDHSRTPTQASRKGKKKDYGRSNGASPVDGLLSPPRLSPCASISELSSGEGDNWQCTFCRVSLTSKSWRRHEETQHHPKHQWICLACGPRIQLPSSSLSICAFCELPNPDDDHFQYFHRIGDCLCKPESERTFGRPDHLQQHAKNFHKCDKPLNELVRDAWHTHGPDSVDNKSWTCGFCHEVLQTWDARATHIAAHFKSGLTMAHWRERSASHSRLLREPFQSEEAVVLDALAGMGATFAEPSNYASAPTSHARVDSAQNLPTQAVRTTTFMSELAAIPDLNFDPFCIYGNPIDTFDSSLTSSATYDPAVSSMAAAVPVLNGGASPLDFGVIGVDTHGNPVYDFSLFHSW